MLPRTFAVVAVSAIAGCADMGWETGDSPDEAVYAGGVAGSSKVDRNLQDFGGDVQDVFVANGFAVTSNTLTVDDSDTGFGGVLGYRFSPHFSVEAGYFELGEAKQRSTAVVDDGSGPVPATTDLRADITGLGLSAMAIWPFSKVWEVYARGGLLLADTELSININLAGNNVLSDSFSTSTTDLFAGVGAAYHFGDRWHIRLEYQRFDGVGNDDTRESDIDLFGLQVMFNIL